MITKVEGACGISATVIADSISYLGHRMTTFEFVFPRFILSEINTHRMLSKNAASTRAVPVDAVIAMVAESPAMMVHWGENNPGMSSKQELTGLNLESAKMVWTEAAKSAINYVKVLTSKVGINGHKQWAGRILEPFTMTKQVISGTEWENFFWLRDHPDAQPEFRELARCAREAMRQSKPEEILVGEWHLPYVALKDGEYWIDEETVVPLEDAIKVSASCCAQVSYRKLDDSLEKAHKIFSMLNIGSSDKPCHASPLEHQATPRLPCGSITTNAKKNTIDPSTWQDGITHMRADGSLWSGNLNGWIQYRQLIKGEALW
jgi:hypothetical protein